MEAVCVMAPQKAIADVLSAPKRGAFAKYMDTPAARERKHLRGCLQRQARQMKVVLFFSIIDSHIAKFSGEYSHYSDYVCTCAYTLHILICKHVNKVVIVRHCGWRLRVIPTTKSPAREASFRNHSDKGSVE